MDLFEKVSTPNLLTYSNVLEQLIDNAVQVQTQISEAVANGFCTQDEIQKIFDKVAAGHQEAVEKYKDVQTEVDLRMRRDLRMKSGIRKMQVTFVELDNFINKKRIENLKKDGPELLAAKKIALETLEIIKDDQNKTPEEEQ